MIARSGVLYALTVLLATIMEQTLARGARVSSKELFRKISWRSMRAVVMKIVLWTNSPVLSVNSADYRSASQWGWSQKVFT